MPGPIRGPAIDEFPRSRRRGFAISLVGGGGESMPRAHHEAHEFGFAERSRSPARFGSGARRHWSPSISNRRYHVHLPGVAYAGLTLLVGVAAANRPNNLVVWAFGAMLAVILLSGLVSGSMLMRVSMRRLRPGRAAVGEPLVVRYEITSRSRFVPSFDLHVEELPARRRADDWSRCWSHSEAWVPRVPARQSYHAEAVFWPQRRGSFRLGRMRVWTSFPFGLVRKSVHVDREQFVLVGPRVHRLRAPLRVVLGDGHGGVRMSAHPGTGEDFHSLREYVQGDGMRSLTWRRLSPNGDPRVVLRSSAAPPRLRVVVNLSEATDRIRFEARDGLDAEAMHERAIAMAASVIRTAHDQGYEVGLTIVGFGGTSIGVRRGHWHCERLIADLARIDLAADRVPTSDDWQSDERVACICVHPGRVDPSVAPSDAVHWSASRFDELLDIDHAIVGPVQPDDPLSGPGEPPSRPSIESGETTRVGEVA